MSCLVCAIAAQSVPAKLLEQSERTYTDKIGSRPEFIELYLYPLFEPCVLSPTAMVELKDGKRRVVEQPISAEGKALLQKILNLPKNKPHQKLYELNRLHDRNRDFIKALTLRGKVFLNMRAFKKVESPIMKAIKANPIDYEAYNCLGRSYLARDEFRAAKEAYIKSILYNPNNDRGWQGLKTTGDELGFDAESRRIMKRAWMVRVSEKEIDLYMDSEIQENETVGPWMSFITAKAAWLFEGVYKTKYPKAKGYVYTVDEDLYAYDFLLEYWQIIKRTKNADDPDLDFLVEVKRKNLLPAYLLFEEAGPICPEIIAVQSDKMIRQIKTYIETFVLKPRIKPAETSQDKNRVEKTP